VYRGLAFGVPGSGVRDPIPNGATIGGCAMAF
jgi:hypothetical protein